MYKNVIIAILFVLSGMQSHAQVNITFDDPELSLQQNWKGEINKFIIHNNQLWLNDTIKSGESTIFMQSAVVENAKWTFEYGLQFNPSSSNYLNIYLTMTDTIFDDNFLGYYIKIGGRNDEISLWEQDGGIHTKIVDGLDGLLDNSVNNGRVEISRKIEGNWELLVYSISGDLLDTNIVSHSRTIYSRYFGLLCIYTSTRADKMYIDNIEINGDAYKDIIPPYIDTIYTRENRVVTIEFSEAIDEQSLLLEENYTASLNIAAPSIITINEENDKAELRFLSDFPEGSPISLRVKNLYDSAGNRIEETEYKFYFIENRRPQFRGIVINEIMADPLPEVGLPNSEYIELYNSSEFPFRLIHWKIGIGEKRAIVPNNILLPGDFLVLRDLPALRNSGSAIYLLSPDSILVDSANFTIKSYGDTRKADGGWSLEQIDPFKTCSGNENWLASIDQLGGTPGIVNSIYLSPLDVLAPELLSVEVEQSAINLIFNEPINTPDINTINIQIEDLLISSIQSVTSQKLKIIFSAPIEFGRLYKGIIQRIVDCEGNKLEQQAFEFAIPEIPTKGDIVINEILFNPKPGGIDFVEVLNNSEKYFNINGMVLANIESGNLGQRVYIKHDSIFEPGDILAFTENAELLKSRFNKTGTLVNQNLPFFGDEQGYVLIIDSNSNVIDSVFYTDSYHYELLKDTEGVSLEQISPERPYHISNWQSASGFVGFGTPGIQNSNYWNGLNVTSTISVEPPVLQPSVAGSEIVKIIYSLDNGPWSANLDIFSIDGIHIAEIANNFPISNTGFFVWNGIDIQGKLANMGLYLLKFQVHNTDGKVQYFTKSLVVAGNLR